MPLLTSCAGLWSGPFLCSCLHGTKRPTERTRYALNTATLAYILNTVHRVLYFTCRCIYLSEGKQCSPNFIAACLGIWSQDNCTVHFFLSTNWNNISRLTGTSFISGTSICLQYPRSYKSNNVTVMLNILIEVSNCFSVGSSYTCIPTGQKTPIRYQHSIRNIKYWLSCTSPFRLITRVSESKWCLFCVTYLYLSYFRALNTQFQFCRAAESIWLLRLRECCSCQADFCWRLQQPSNNHSIAVVLHLLWQEGNGHRDAWTVLGFAPCQQSSSGSFGTQQGRATLVKCQQQWPRGLSRWANFELSECSLELHLLKSCNPASWRARPFITCSTYALTKC